MVVSIEPNNEIGETQIATLASVLQVEKIRKGIEMELKKLHDIKDLKVRSGDSTGCVKGDVVVSMSASCIVYVYEIALFAKCGSNLGPSRCSKSIHKVGQACFPPLHHTAAVTRQATPSKLSRLC